MLCLPLNKTVLTVLLCLAITQTALSNNILPVFRVDTTDKTDFQVGQALGNAIKQRFPDIEARYDSYLNTLTNQAKFDQVLQQQVNAIRSRIDPAYQDEVAGITSGWQLFGHDQLGDGRLSLNEYWTFILLPDLGHFSVQGSVFGVWHTASASGTPIIGRNLDWPADANLRSLQAITIYTGTDHNMVNIGFAGCPGILSGFNQAGLFLAQIASPLSRPGRNSPDYQDSVAFALRKALETATNNQQATKQLSRYHYAADHNMVMADHTSIQVLEKPQKMPARIRTDKSNNRADKLWGKTDQIAVVNCYLSAHSPDNCTHSQDNFRWQRFSQLAVFDRGHPAAVKDIISIMLDKANRYQAIFNQHTLQSMVFTPADNTLHLYHTPPSGQGTEHPVMQVFHNLLPAVSQKSGHPPLIMLIALGAFALIAMVYYFEFYRKRQQS